jgi:hypothetical protein
MKEAKGKKTIKPGQIWTVKDGLIGFYIVGKDKKNWFGLYVKRLSKNKFIESEYMSKTQSKNKKISIREQNLLTIFKLEEGAELVSGEE